MATMRVDPNHLVNDEQLTVLRKHYGNAPNANVVSPTQFYSMLLSRSKLQRCDIPEANFIGLRNEATGTSYFVESEKVLPLLRGNSVGPSKVVT